MAQMTDCTNCQSPVAVRRPSHSGHHYCPRKECQTAKQKFYRNRKAEEATADLRQEALELVQAIVSGSRTECHKCGLTDALVGWAHRDETGVRPCYALGTKGRAVGSPFLDAVHPERVPGAAPQG